MMKIIGIVLARTLTFYLILAMLIISSIPSQSAAMFITPEAELAALDSAEDMAAVRTFLESKIVRQRLADFGLTSEEVSSRLNQLSSEQLHQIATHIDQVDFGGDTALGILISLIVIVILIIVVLKLLGRQVIIQ